VRRKPALVYTLCCILLAAIYVFFFLGSYGEDR
jgi:hypothetical protein